MKFLDYDKLINFWILNVPYIWVGHKEIEKCKRIFLVPSYELKGTTKYTTSGYLYTDSFYKKTLLASTFFDNLYLMDKQCDSHSTIFESFFQVADIYDATLLLDNYTQQGYFCELREASEEDDEIISKKFIPNPSKRRLTSPNLHLTYADKDKDILIHKKISLNISQHPLTFSEYPGITFYENIKDLSNDMPLQSYSSYEMEGRRSSMEDVSLFCKLTTSNKNIFIIAILDGHGDEGKASYHFSREISRQLLRLVEETSILNEEIIKETFLVADENFYIDNSIPGGTCFSGVIIDDENIFIVNLGDSRTTLILENKEKFLTNDHKSKNLKELNRIFDKIDKDIANGNIKDGDLRNIIINHGISLYGRMITSKGDLGLNVFRTLGDNEYKYDYLKFYENEELKRTSENVKWTGVHSYISPLPDIQKIKREDYKNEEANILIHCDGINEPSTMKDEDVIINEYFTHRGTNYNISEQICSMAFRNRSGDNLSMITLQFKM